MLIGRLEIQVKVRHKYYFDSCKWYLSHHGYWLDDIVVKNEDLLKALEVFEEKFRIRMKEELEKYDFKNHHEKETK